jgi:hypothetical protein
MRREWAYFATLGLLGVVALPADLTAVQALPLGPGMQRLLAVGLAVVTMVAAHAGAHGLAGLVARWPQRHRVPWRFWLDLGRVVVVLGGTLAMLVAFGLLRGDSLGVVARLTGDDELQAAGGTMTAALFGLQFVAFAVALALGVARQQHRRRDRLERQIARLDRQIGRHQRRADQAGRSVLAAEATIARLDRELALVGEQIAAWAAERHSRCDYQWQKQRIKAARRQHRLAQRQPTGLPASHVAAVEPGDVLEAVAAHASRANGADHAPPRDRR